MFTTLDDHPRIGVTCLSPGATAMVGQVENQVALGGASSFVIVGTAGSIRLDVVPSSVVVVDCAVRDDGISQHYLPPDTYVDADPELVADFLASLLAVAEALDVAAGACLSVMSSLVGHDHDPSLIPADPSSMLESALDALGISR